MANVSGAPKETAPQCGGPKVKNPLATPGFAVVTGGGGSDLRFTEDGEPRITEDGDTRFVDA